MTSYEEMQSRMKEYKNPTLEKKKKTLFSICGHSRRFPRRQILPGTILLPKLHMLMLLEKMVKMLSYVGTGGIRNICILAD